MVCKQCGGSIPEGGKFCPECGAPVSLKATAIKKPSKAAHTARPLADNPFQPRATYKKPAAKDPIALDAMDDAADAEDVLVEESTPIPAAPRPKPRTGARKAPQSVDLDTADAVDVEDVEDVASDETDADGALTSAPQKKRPPIPSAPSTLPVHALAAKKKRTTQRKQRNPMPRNHALESVPTPSPRKAPNTLPPARRPRRRRAKQRMPFRRKLAPTALPSRPRRPPAAR